MSKHAHVEIESIYGGFDATVYMVDFLFIYSLNDIYMYIFGIL